MMASVSSAAGAGAAAAGADTAGSPAFSARHPVSSDNNTTAARARWITTAPILNDSNDSNVSNGSNNLID
jgi:hypothetical protein